MKGVIQEILNIDDSELDLHVKQNSTLHEKFWDEDKKLKPEVREVLLQIAENFISFLKLPKDIEIDDITFTGSLANYNYTQYSDVDLHVLIDKSKIDINDDFKSEYFDSKKYVFNEKYNFKMFGYDVELYAQDTNEEHFSDGIYSILNDKWVTEPEKDILVIDNDSVKAKVESISALIDRMNTDNITPEKIDYMKNKIKNMRNAGLEEEGKYSPENLTFKILRNTGYIDKLANLKVEILNKELSLKENNKIK